jgi:hypothetical protein
MGGRTFHFTGTGYDPVACCDVPWYSIKFENILSSWKINSFSKRTQVHGMSRLVSWLVR